MNVFSNLRACLLALAALSVVTGSVSAAQLVPLGSQWKYFIGTNEASLPDTTAWRALGFNDSAWETGVGPVGYTTDASGMEGPFRISLPHLPTSNVGGYDCVFFRKTFTVSSLANVLSVRLTTYVDDGAVVWINGVEAGRVNAPTGPLSYTNVTGMLAEEYKTLDVTLPGTGNLVVGNNIIAIQAFNATRGSSDFFVEASLVTVEDEAPVTAVDPAPGTTLTALDFINVVFSEGVTGVNAADLLINGAPATSIATNNPNDYTFYFPAPPTGAVNVAWASGHGIVDTDGTPNAFAGGSWSYTLDPNAFASLFYISEFLTDNANLIFNGRAVQDEDGDRSDWIEIYNPGNVAGDLRGWYLTDAAADLTKWQFPTDRNVPIPARGYLIVWASGKNRKIDPTRLHTNFQLSRSGEFLALVNRQTNIVSSYSPAYPVQNTDVSYGLDITDTNNVGYYISPTPGAQNATSGSGFAAEPIISHDDGVFTNNSISVTISLPPGETGTIRYTLDGSEPTATSTVYSAPLTFSVNTFLKVRVFRNGVFPGPIVARTYFFLDNSTRDFSSNLPIIVMHANSAVAQSVPPGGNRTKGSVLVLDTFRGRASFRGPVDYQGLAELEIFGQTSAGFPKQPYNIETIDEYGGDKNVSLLGFPADADWKLRNPYSDKCLMNDFLAYELWEDMGNYSVRRRFVEVFLSTSAGKINYTTNYYGVMVFLEKIEQDKNRVDIKKLTPAINTEPEITGGYMWKKDKDSTGDLNFTLPGTNGFAAQGLKIHEPKPRDITTNQLNWLQRWLGALNTSLHANDWLTRTGTNHYSHYIDMDNFVDHHWIVEFPKQIDGYRLSNFMQKDRDGKAQMSPIWDWNLSFGNANYLQGGRTNGWYWNVYTEGMTSAEHIWLRRLLYGSNNVTGNINTDPLPEGTYINSGDPEFIQKMIDRWGVLRTNVMNGDRVVGRIDEIANLLSEAAVRNYLKYPILGTYIWPNPNGGTTWHIDYQNPRTYEGIIAEMKKWTMGRYLWIDKQFTKAPQFSVPEGQLSSSTNVTLTTATPGATIYYTLDGSDPRAPGGNVAPGALVYTGSILMANNAHVFARARSGTNQYSWSPPNSARYYRSIPPLRITEIMYHPADFGTSFGDEDFEYLELRNTSVSSLNIANFRLRGGIDFVFPNITLAPGQRVLVVNNTAAFSALYNTNGLIIAGEFTGENNLDNTGERLILEGRFGEPIHDFRYDDDWYKITDGLGFSLVIKNDTLPTGTWADPASWRPSGALNGSPGAADPAQPAFPQVVINEVLTHTDPPQVDAIELHNLGKAPADISNWWLSDDRLSAKKYRVPAGTVIQPGGYWSVSENQFNAGGAGFALSSLGDEVYVFSGNAAGELTGYIHGFSFGPQKNGVTFGRHVTSIGDEHFVSQSADTIGAANSGPLVNNVIISEINYHPVDVFANGAYWNNSEDEYIELHNRGTTPAQLFDPANPANTWRLNNAVEFQFPTNTTIPAGGYLLVVNFNPVRRPQMLADFRAKFNVPAGVQILGPYEGDLSNEDETIELEQPDTPAPGQELPYVLVEQVRYDDEEPWPFTPDGMGQTLNRLNFAQYADDVANWGAGNPNAGQGFIPDSPAVITAHPQDQTVIAADTAAVVFSVSATGNNLRYQWRRNGQAVPGGTSANLVISPVKLTDAGEYDVLVMNNSTVAVSSNATLNVLNGVRVHAHPRDLTLRPGVVTNFSVAASSDTAITYQWRRNGIAIPGANSSNYTFTVTFEARGEYDVILTDEVGAIRSLPATLEVLIDPIVVQSPASQTVRYGGSATFSTVVTNTATLPIEYRWRVNSRGVVTNILNRHYDFFTLTNILGSSNVAVGVLNASRPGGILSGTAVVSVFVDSDNDGIPDAWEAAHGFNTNSAADATLDTDGDTMVNRDEYIAGTNPTNALSYLKVDTINPVNGATLTFGAVSNKTYTIQYSEALGETWGNLISTPARPTNWTAEVNDPGGTGNRYYRIATPSTE